jgi:uncharacterized protein (DUF885 family)
MTPEEIADRLLHDLAPLEPEAAEALGREPDSVVPSLAPEDFEARRAAHERAVRDLDAHRDEHNGSVLALVLRERAGAEISLDDVGFTRALLAPLATPVHAVRSVFDQLPHETPEQWERVGEHLDQVPAALRDYAATLRASAAGGHVVAARQVTSAAAQCEQWVGADDFYRRLVAPAGSASLDQAATRAGAATADFAAFLRTELLPLAPTADAVGPERYAVTARAFLGDDVDLAETYAFGWDELATLSAEMEEAADALRAGSVEEAAATLDADPRQRLASPEDLLSWLHGRVAEICAEVDGVHFDLPPQAGPPECVISPAASGVMYYAPPDPAFTRPGRVVWSPTDGRVSHVWREVSTVHHEGVPGHHLQITTAMAEPTLHPWQRSMAHVHGYAEGWAHYAERLCEELGLLRDPAERLGMLFGQRWRAARIVIDMGLHLQLPIPAGNGLTEATRWTPEVAVDALCRASGLEEAPARFEVDRYLGWPAQALAFRVGARLWRQVREEALRRTDLRGFHRDALRLGPMGLGPLREVLG